MHRRAQLWGAKTEAVTPCWRNLSSYVLESSSAGISSISTLNLLVANANLIVAETISRVGFQLCNGPSFFSLAQPPSAKDRSPRLLAFLAILRRSWRCSSHRGHLNKKWSTDSDSRPHVHMSVSAAPIFAKYPFNLHIPDLSRQRILASTFERPLYNIWVCFPGKALSILCVNFPVDGLTQGDGGGKKSLRPLSNATDCSSA